MKPRANYELLRRPILVNFGEGVRGYEILVYVSQTRCEGRLGILVMGLSPKIGPAIRRDGQKCLCVNAPVKKDEVLITYDGPIIDHPTRYSIQIDDDRHIEGTAESNAYLNHSCAPNAYVDWNGVYLRAQRDIDAGEEVTGNYLTTDWELHERFICHCGASNCYGELKGLKYLAHDEQKKLLPFLPEFVKRKVPD